MHFMGGIYWYIEWKLCIKIQLVIKDILISA
jgi:hypothetical protein